MSDVTDPGLGDPRASAPMSEEMQYAAARVLLEQLNFVEWRNGWLQHGELYAFVDSWLSPKNQRYVGLFRHRLDDAGADMMHPVVLVPWYGDGEELQVASNLVFVAVDAILNDRWTVA